MAVDTNMGIMLVDDDKSILMFLGAILNESGFKNVLQTTNPDEAVKLLNNHTVNVIILDGNLEKTTGIESIPRFREVTPDIKIIMLSGSATIKNVHDSLDAGANGFISKPFNQNKIIHALEHIDDYDRR